LDLAGWDKERTKMIKKTIKTTKDQEKNVINTIVPGLGEPIV